MCMPVEVSAAVICRDGCVLVTRRPEGKAFGGMWEFPGGKRRPSESPEACLVRELREELGIEVEVLRLLHTVRHSYPELDVLIRFYHCRILDGEPRPIQCSELRWVPPAELCRLEFPEADRALIELLRGPGFPA